MSESKGWSCYILECADRSYHVGVATDVQEREQSTTPDTGLSTPRLRRPVRLDWSQACSGYAEARALETRLKGWSRERKRLLVVGSLRLDYRLAQSEPTAFTNPTLSATYRPVRSSAIPSGTWLCQIRYGVWLCHAPKLVELSEIIDKPGRRKLAMSKSYYVYVLRSLRDKPLRLVVPPLQRSGGCSRKRSRRPSSHRDVT